MRLTAIFLSALFALSFSSCLKDSCERTVSYIRLEAVYKTSQEIRDATAVGEAPRALKNPGQLYYYDNKIFINERREGIHVIDNTDPVHPQNIAFIAIPGNEDLAIRNGVLYANAYVDLLAIDLLTYQEIGRAESVFQPLWKDVQNGTVAVFYEETPVTEVMNCQTYGALRKQGDVFYSVDVLSEAGFDDFIGSSGAAGGSGIGGSMARFTMANDHLYVVDEQRLHVFSLSNPAVPERASTVHVGWGIETIIPYEDKLFIGSSSGMFIFDNSNPLEPYLLSTFAHARACDPVFVQGNLAYVTLRSGTPCEGFSNQLDVVDITHITNPSLVATIPMQNPHGLSVKGSDLLLCEGEYGFKRFDATNPHFIGSKQLDHVKDFHAFDVISLPGVANIALVIGDDGFYQFSFDDPKKLALLSKIPVGN